MSSVQCLEVVDDIADKESAPEIGNPGEVAEEDYVERKIVYTVTTELQLKQLKNVRKKRVEKNQKLVDKHADLPDKNN